MEGREGRREGLEGRNKPTLVLESDVWYRTPSTLVSSSLSSSSLLLSRSLSRVCGVVRSCLPGRAKVSGGKPHNVLAVARVRAPRLSVVNNGELAALIEVQIFGLQVAVNDSF